MLGPWRGARPLDSRAEKQDQEKIDQALADFRDRVGREVPSVCHPTRGYPKTLDALLKFDVVIFSDIIKEGYSQEQLDATVGFVEGFGGGFIMIGGMTSFGAGDYQKTVIDKLMPIEVAGRSDPINQWTGVAVTDSGWQHPVMQVGENAEETKQAWSTGFPGFSGFNYVRRAKPGAFTLARSSMKVMGEPALLLAVQQIGRGRTMAFTSDSTRDWGTAFQTVWGPSRRSNAYYRKFWNHTIRWLAAEHRNPEGTPVTTRIGVSVSEDANEAVAVAVNRKLMETLATGTGGQLVDASQIGEVLERIHARAAAHPSRVDSLMGPLVAPNAAHRPARHRVAAAPQRPFHLADAVSGLPCWSGC